MQDEINEKAINLAVQVGKLTFEEIKKQVEKALADYKQSNHSTKTRTARKKPELKHGKQTRKQLHKHLDGLSSMDLTDPNLRLLYREMKKADIDFAAEKDGKGKYILYFKCRDEDEMARAFNKYTQKVIKRANTTPPIQKILAAAKAAAKALEAGRNKEKNRGKGARDR